MRRFMLLALCLAASLMAGAAMAGQLVVVSSSVDKWKAGQVLPPGTALDVPEGGKVTLVGSDGKTLVIKGPYKGTPQAPAGSNDLADKLSKMLSASATDNTTLGATRNVSLGGSSDGRKPFSIDSSNTGTQCALADAPPQIWRGGASRSATGSLSRVGSGEQGALRWEAREQMAAWPADVAITSGGRYLLRVQGRSSPAEFQLKLVPGNLSTDGHRALWMLEQGCGDQARLLLEGEG